MGIGKLMETGIKDIGNGNEKGIGNGDKNRNLKILVIKKGENICHFGYTFYPHLWAPERGQFC